ncbi:MAG: type II secretion system F family protein [Acidimicrobiia bacterium]|nr:type II secretion system F family protein [Acidimicrobiia bacterium]
MEGFAMRGWLVVAAASLGWRGVVGVALWWAMRWLRQTRSRTDQPLDIDGLSVLVVIGLSASLSLHAALEAASKELGEPPELVDLLRRARRAGLARALAETEGPLAELATQLARAQVTGAPIALAVAAYLETQRSAQRASLLEAARTLPVKLIIPLALCLLPGFVLLVVGPFVLDQFIDLELELVP